MFNKILLSVALLLTFLFSGCGMVTSKPYQEIKPQKDVALVYVYRPESLIYRGVPYYIYQW